MLGDCFRRAREFEEHRASRAFDDRAEKTIAWDGLCRRRQRAAQPGVRTRAVDDDNGQPTHRAFVDFGRGRLAVWALHLSLPALEVGVDATTLAGSEVVHDAFRDALIICDWRQ